MEQPPAPYIGNGHYCYANATAMLLASVGERVLPEVVEVLTGVGLGALWLTEQEVFFFGFVAPDRGISRALDLLGFEVAEHAGQDGDAPPFSELAEALAAGPAVLGPLDMGHLTYAPGCGTATGMDHYVLAYALDATELHLHDPAGFPHVSLPVADLVRAWRAERVTYRRGPFRWWSAPRRIRHPTGSELLAGALRTFERIYAEADSHAAPGVVTGSLAIRQLADRVAGGELPPHFAGHLVRFVFQLAARRALDYAAFFEDCRPALAEAKREQAMLLGRCHTLAVRRDWPGLASRLGCLADTEDQFRVTLCAAGSGA